MTIILMWNNIHFEYMQFTLHPVPIIYKTRGMFTTKLCLSIVCTCFLSIIFCMGKKKKQSKVGPQVVKGFH